MVKASLWPLLLSLLVCVCVCVWGKCHRPCSPDLDPSFSRTVRPYWEKLTVSLPGLSFCTKQFHHSFRLLLSSPCLNSFIISSSDQTSLRLLDVCAGQQDKGSCPGSLLTGATEADLPLLFPSHGAFCRGKTALIRLFHSLKSSTFCSLSVCVHNQNFSLYFWLDLT